MLPKRSVGRGEAGVGGVTPIRKIGQWRIHGFVARSAKRGRNTMPYETKVLLKMMAKFVLRAKSMKDVYSFIAEAANAEGVVLPSYEEAKKQDEELESE